jgi:hypothetical protein
VSDWLPGRLEKSDRNNEPIGEAFPLARKSSLSLGRSVAVRNGLTLVAQLVNFLEHLLRRHLGRIVTNVQPVCFQIDANLLDAWKP